MQKAIRGITNFKLDFNFIKVAKVGKEYSCAIPLHSRLPSIYPSGAATIWFLLKLPCARRYGKNYYLSPYAGAVKGHPIDLGK